MKAKSKQFNAKNQDRSLLLKFLTKLGPDKIIGITQEGNLGSGSTITIFYWEK